MTTRVLLVDDHELLRAGLRSRLEKEPGIEVVGEADSAERAVVLARTLQPDLVLLDLLLPRRNGFEAIPEILQVAPDARVVVDEQDSRRHFDSPKARSARVPP